MADKTLGPLVGKRIAITRPAAQSDALAQELAGRGAIPVVLPLVSFAEPEDLAPLDDAIAGMGQFDWLVLTSAQAVRALQQRAAQLRQPMAHAGGKPGVACVGPVTAEAAKKAGLAVEYVAASHNGVALANELGEKLREAKVLLPRSDRANPDLPAALKRYGAKVTEVIAYRTLRAGEANQEGLKRIADGGADAILFFSPSAVQHFAELFGAEQMGLIQDKLAITAVGPVTAKAMHQAGVQRAVIAEDTTAASVIEALERHFAGETKTAQAGVKRG